MKKQLFLFSLIILGFNTFSQDSTDLRDLMVGEYSFKSIEKFSQYDEVFKGEGHLIISKSDSNLLLIKTFHEDKLVNVYLAKIKVSTETKLGIEIAKHTSPKSDNFIHTGKGEYYINGEKLDGTFNKESNEFLFSVKTDKISVNRFQSKSYICIK